MFSVGLNLFSPLLVGRALGAHEMFWVMKHHPKGPPEEAWVSAGTAHVTFLSLSPSPVPGGRQTLSRGSTQSCPKCPQKVSGGVRVVTPNHLLNSG